MSVKTRIERFALRAPLATACRSVKVKHVAQHRKRGTSKDQRPAWHPLPGDPRPATRDKTPGTAGRLMKENTLFIASLPLLSFIDDSDCSATLTDNPGP
jgi:hypothetical protein